MYRNSTALAFAGALMLLTSCSDNPAEPRPAAGDALSVQSASAAQHTSASVFTHMARGPMTQVTGAVATMVSNDAGTRVTLQTRELRAGNAYTMWWVHINRPDLCLSSPCSGMDVLGRSAIILSDVAYAAGHVVGGSGKGAFAAHFGVGEVSGGWFGNAFTNPRGAEIHLIVMDHGPKIPQLVANQISTLRGGCTDESVPAAFPPVAHADGIPGPNTCQLYQVAILQQ